MSPHCSRFFIAATIVFFQSSFAMNLDDDGTSINDTPNNLPASRVHPKPYPPLREDFKELPAKPQQPPHAQRKKSRDDGEIGLKLVKGFAAATQLRSNSEEDISNRQKKKKTGLFVRESDRKKAQLFIAYAMRKQYYLAEFFGNDIPSGYLRNPFFGESVLAKIAKLTTETQVISFLRDSANFANDFKALRIITKSSLSNLINELYTKNDLGFIENQERIAKVFQVMFELTSASEPAHMLIDFDLDTGTLVEVESSTVEEIKQISFQKISSMEIYQRHQAAYLEFFQHWILPLVENVPPRVIAYFNKLSTAVDNVLKNDPNARYRAEDLVSTNFFLFIIVPLLRDHRLDLITFSDEEIKKLESDECKRSKLKTAPEVTSEEFKDFASGMLVRMEKNQRMEATHGDDHVRKELEASLVCLLLKTFGCETEFSSSTYKGFMCTFYDMLGNKESEHHASLNKLKVRLGNHFLPPQ